MNRIKELRLKKGLSQRDLAKILNVTAPSVFKWENNKAVMTVENAKLLADFFDVSIDYLLSYEKSNEQLSKFAVGDEINLRGTVASIGSELILFQTESGYAVWLNREEVEESSELRGEI